MDFSALQSLDPKVSTDVFPSLLEWVFDCEAFQRWHRGNGTWQLHCIGGPGSGKVSKSLCCTTGYNIKRSHRSFVPLDPALYMSWNLTLSHLRRGADYSITRLQVWPAQGLTSANVASDSLILWQTTLARLASQHLRQHPEHHGQPVVSISIVEDISDDMVDLTEAFLLRLYEGLNVCPLLRSDESDRAFGEYIYWRDHHPEGAKRSKRLQCLRKAVHTRLEATEEVSSILIVDGIDRCGSTIRYMLETELADLQCKRTKILLTSRSATFEQTQALCDHDCHEITDGNPLDMYLQCGNDDCEGFAICLVCKDAGRGCSKW